MIDPKSLDINSLPFVPLENRNNLPEEPCIYFAVDKYSNIQYIGRSVNARSRWSSHHKLAQLQLVEGARIAYLFVDAELLSSVEIALIQWFLRG